MRARMKVMLMEFHMSLGHQIISFNFACKGKTKVVLGRYKSLT